MRGPSLASSVLAARLLLLITLVSRSSFAAGTTSVQDGDTFQAIAESAGIPVASLEAANPGVSADNLYVGQAISIPSNNGPAAATPVSESESSTAAGASPTGPSAISPTPSTFATSILPLSPTTIPPPPSSTPPSSTPPPPSSTPPSSTPPPPSSTPPSSTPPPPSSTPPSSTPPPPSSTPPSSTPPPPSSTPPSSTPPPPSSTPPSSTLPPPSSTPRSSTPPPPSSTPPPPPPAPAGPTTTAPVSPSSAPSCAPTPSGIYHDADDVQSKTNTWCAQVAAMSEKQIVGSPGFQISGSSQGKSGHDGNLPNEAGYNMTITASQFCDVPGSTAQYPLGSVDTNDNCTFILYNAWSHCNNKGMRGSITAGCLTYAFLPDP